MPNWVGFGVTKPTYIYSSIVLIIIIIGEISKKRKEREREKIKRRITNK